MPSSLLPKNPFNLTQWLILIAICHFVVMTIYIVPVTEFTRIEYTFENKNPVGLQAFPMEVQKQSAIFDVRATLKLNGKYPTVYELTKLDCIEGIMINDQSVKDIRYPLCGKQSLDLSQYLRRGNNYLYFRIRDNGEVANFNMTWEKEKSNLLSIFQGVFLAMVLVISYRILK